MDANIDLDFTPAEFAGKCLGKANEELLLQWGLTDTLSVTSFNIIGSCPPASALDVTSFAKCLLANTNVLRLLQINDTPPAKIDVVTTPLQATVRTMAFFDTLSENGIVSPTGSLRGCFEEVYHGYTTGDKLREMLVNEESENASAVFSATEKNELIFQLFKIFALGGTMCQPDLDVNRYLMMTQALYKDLVTIYRASDNNEVKISTRAVQVHSVGGLNLFSNSENVMNSLYLVIDPLEKTVHVIKYDAKSAW